MTAEETYDFLVSVGINDAAAARFGDLHVIGRWVNTASVGNSLSKFVLTNREKAVEVLGQGASWSEAVQDGGFWQKYLEHQESKRKAMP